MNDLRIASRIALVYTLIALVWILVTDWISFQAASTATAQRIEIAKGVAFVLVTGVLLFWRVGKSTKLLCESEERFRLLVEGAPDAVVVERGGRIVYVNEALVRLVGAANRQAIVGREISAFIQGAALRALQQELGEGGRSKTPIASQEVSFQRSDGGTVLCEASAVAVTYDGAEATLVFIRDITALAKARERQHAEQNMAVVRQLAGGLAHDLNNLLQVINGYTELAVQMTAEGRESRDCLEQVRISVQRSSALVGRLLAFSKTEDTDKAVAELNAMSAVTRNGTQRLPLQTVLSGTVAPVKRVEAAQTPAPQGSSAVLIAEDDDHVRNLSVKILRRDGYVVFEASDGDEAVRLFKEHGREIKAVILDVVMPHMDGFQAYEQIHEIDARVPILFASGYSGIDSPSHVALVPGVNLLQKPFDSELLLTSLRRAVSKGEVRASA